MGDAREHTALDLSSILESEVPEKVKQAMDECLAQAQSFEEQYKGHVGDLTPSEFFTFYKELDTVQTTFYRHYFYAWLRQSQDFTDSIARSLFEYAMKIQSDLQSRLLFSEIEVARILTERPGLAHDSCLAEYRHSLVKILEKGKYLLSESDENLISKKDLFGVYNWYQLHSELKNTRLYRVIIDGEEKEMGFSELRSIAEGSHDRNTRKVASEALYEGLSKDKFVYAIALRSIFGNYLNEAKMRGYPSVLTKTLIDEDISEATLDSLVSTIKKKTGIIKKYISLRAKMMNLPKLTGYDISAARVAPIFEDQSNISWSETRRLLVESYTEFDNEAGEFIASLFNNNRIDAGPRPGKRGQAFCCGFPTLRTAFVSVPRIGSSSAIAGLAHECGHALHMFYASEKHRFINTMYGGCIAETGSIFGEMIVIDKLIEESKSDETKLSVLDNILSSLYSMVYSILNAYLFEKRVFIAMQNNEFIDAEKLGSIWKTARTEIFGDSVDWLPGMELTWVVPTQFFWPKDKFYNFPYAFARLLVFVLYLQYKEEGELFVPKMKRILSAGASESPKTLLEEIGLDISDPLFWEIGFKQAEMYLGEFEQLVNQLT